MNTAVCSMLATLLLGSAEPSAPYARSAALPNRPVHVAARDDGVDSLVPFRRTEASAPGAGPADKAPLPRRQGLKLPKQNANEPDAGPKPPATAARTLVTMASSLAIVLGLFFLVSWLWRRNAPKGLSMLSSDVVEVLGRSQLAGKQQMHLVRVGAKLLLVSATPAGLETLTEITDTDEVNRLVALCRRGEANSISSSFRQVLSQLGGEPAAPGFVDDGDESGFEPADMQRTATRRDSWGGADA